VNRALLAIVAGFLLVAVIILLPLGGSGPAGSSSQTTISRVQSSSETSTASSSSSSSVTSIASTFSSSSSKMSTTALSTCVFPAPAEAQETSVWNSTFEGMVLTYSNGTTGYFSEFSCPQPLSTEDTGSQDNFTTVSQYELALAAETNSTFVNAENGSQYVPNSYGFEGASVGLGPREIDVYFWQYSASSSNVTCSANISLFQRPAVAGMLVIFKTYCQYVYASCINVWNLHDPNIQFVSSSQVTEHNFDVDVDVCGGP
jgi:hypothetical protein